MSANNYIILGLGLSGKAALNYLVENNNKVRVFDDNKAILKQVVAENPKLVEPFSPPFTFKGDEILIVSPAIRTKHNPHKLVSLAKAKGCQIKGELGLFLERNPRLRVVAVTGTNGKSTAVSMLAHVLNQNNIEAVACGNIGIPLCSIKPNLNTVYVVEASSYQLEIDGFAFAHTALLLNVTADHLDYHGTFDNYKTAKHKIFQNASHKALVGTEKLKGVTNFSTHLDAIVAIAKSFGIAKKDALLSVENFTPLPHRRQRLGQIRHITFINDSKATNPEATLFALRELKSTPVFWLGGGRAKGNFDALRGKQGKMDIVQKGFVFGECAKNIKDELTIDCEIHKELSSAFEAATQAAENFNQKCVILLSPAASSFDQWQNFSARGDAFCKLAYDYISQHIQQRGNNV